MKNSGQTTNLLSRFMLKQKCFLSFPIKALQSTPSAVRLGQIREIVGIHQGTKTILKLHRNFYAPTISLLRISNLSYVAVMWVRKGLVK